MADLENTIKIRRALLVKIEEERKYIRVAAGKINDRKAELDSLEIAIITNASTDIIKELCATSLTKNTVVTAGNIVNLNDFRR